MLDRVWLLRPEGVFSFAVGDNPDDAVRLAGFVGVEQRTGQRHGFLWNGEYVERLWRILLLGPGGLLRDSPRRALGGVRSGGIDRGRGRWTRAGISGFVSAVWRGVWLCTCASRAGGLFARKRDSASVDVLLGYSAPRAGQSVRAGSATTRRRPPTHNLPSWLPQPAPSTRFPGSPKPGIGGAVPWSIS
jgi:hypothetical protein